MNVLSESAPKHVSCELALSGDPRHTRQVVTGFFELAAAGIIDLTVRPSDEWPESVCAVKATVNGCRLIYETMDGWNIPADLHASLKDIDYYFKRSLDLTRRQDVPATVRLLPLGLNYLAVSRHNTWHRGTRPLNARRLANHLVRRASGALVWAGLRDVRDMRIADLECSPAVSTRPTALFMTRAWDPKGCDSQVAAGRQELNDGRAACIKAARHEFGERFYGGFAADDFSRREYGDCLLPGSRDGEQYALVQRVRQADVCVATHGLHGCIGWKMAEYVAASRAIVSEPLLHVLPGGFAAGINYLEFCSVNNFVEAIGTLFTDADLRLQMMQANNAYYRQWVRPDAQVLQTLRIVQQNR